jgi:hypothetical protein
MSLKKVSTALLVGVLMMSASIASADVVADFESSNPFTAAAGYTDGTLSTTYAASGIQSLYLYRGNAMFLPIASAAAGGTVTMKVYDQGKWSDAAGSVYGARWGVADGTNCGAFSLIQKSYLGSSAGYGYADGSIDGDAIFGSWFSPYFYGPRQVVSLSPTPNDGSVGEGKWTTWYFDIAPGGLSVAMYREGDSANAVTATFASIVSEIIVYGGRDSDTVGMPLAGIYVDDVTWTRLPEPATMSLLVGGALALLRRRNR